MSDKILQIVPAQTGWYSTYKASDKNELLLCEVSLWVLLEDANGDRRISSFSPGALGEPMCEYTVDDNVSNFVGWDFKGKTKCEPINRF